MKIMSVDIKIPIIGNKIDEELGQNSRLYGWKTALRTQTHRLFPGHNASLCPLTKPNPQVRDGSTINVSLPSPKEAPPEEYLQPFHDSVFFFIYFETLA
jgi:hypothetical protein